MSQLPIRFPLFQGHSRSFWTPTLGCKEENVAKVLRVIADGCHIVLFTCTKGSKCVVLLSVKCACIKSNVSSGNAKKKCFETSYSLTFYFFFF